MVENYRNFYLAYFKKCNGVYWKAQTNSKKYKQVNELKYLGNGGKTLSKCRNKYVKIEFIL